MVFDWFKIINVPEFIGASEGVTLTDEDASPLTDEDGVLLTDEPEVSGLVSKELTLFLEGYGEKEILVTRGNTTAITYEGIFLPSEFLGKNPFIREGRAVYKDANEDLWLGIEVTA